MRNYISTLRSASSTVLFALQDAAFRITMGRPDKQLETRRNADIDAGGEFSRVSTATSHVDHTVSNFSRAQDCCLHVLVFRGLIGIVLGIPLVGPIVGNIFGF